MEARMVVQTLKECSIPHRETLTVRGEARIIRATEVHRNTVEDLHDATAVTIEQMQGSRGERKEEETKEVHQDNRRTSEKNRRRGLSSEGLGRVRRVG